jgi:hypothetical protein
MAEWVEGIRFISFEFRSIWRMDSAGRSSSEVGRLIIEGRAGSGAGVEMAKVINWEGVVRRRWVGERRKEVQFEVSCLGSPGEMMSSFPVEESPHINV